MEERAMAGLYFGTTKKIEAAGGYKPQAEMIYVPMEKEDAIRLFCSGCGHYGELPREMAEKNLGESLPAVIDKGQFIETTGCEACNGLQENFEFKKI
jgi:hypothetical protein